MSLGLLPSLLLLLTTFDAACSQEPPRIYLNPFYDSETEHARNRFLSGFDKRLEMLAKLSTLTVIPELKNATLADVLEYLSDCHHVTVIIDTKAFERAGVKAVEKLIVAQEPLLDLKGPSARQVLEAVLAQLPAQSGATLIVRRDYIEITTEREWQATLQRRVSRLGELLLRVVTKCESLDQLGAMFWWMLNDLLGQRLDD